jgi:hypothetical protein
MRDVIVFSIRPVAKVLRANKLTHLAKSCCAAPIIQHNFGEVATIQINVVRFDISMPPAQAMRHTNNFQQCDEHGVGQTHMDRARQHWHTNGSNNEGWDLTQELHGLRNVLDPCLSQFPQHTPLTTRHEQHIMTSIVDLDHIVLCRKTCLET